MLAQTRLWLGTPYRHQASVLGAGCDCLGLVRGVWRALHGSEPEVPPPYRPDWAETGGRELLLEAFGRWLIPLPLTQARPGDVLIFRMAPGAVAKHCAIQSGPDRMIHAYWGRACVESVLGRWWRERLVAVFAFPSPNQTSDFPRDAGAQMQPERLTARAFDGVRPDGRVGSIWVPPSPGRSGEG